MGTDFIRISNKVVRLDSIGYVDFLESGRAMVLVPGLSAEKQLISVDVEEAKCLREFFDSRVLPLGRDSNRRGA